MHIHTPYISSNSIKFLIVSNHHYSYVCPHMNDDMQWPNLHLSVLSVYTWYMVIYDIHMGHIGYTNIYHVIVGYLIYIWRFPEIGVPLVIIHFHGIFHSKPSIWRNPHLWKPPYMSEYLATFQGSMSCTKRPSEQTRAQWGQPWQPASWDLGLAGIYCAYIYIFLFIYIYIFIYVYIYIYLYTYMFKYYILTYIYIYMCICMYVYIYIYQYVYVYIYIILTYIYIYINTVYIYTYVCVLVCTYIYIYIYKYIHIVFFRRYWSIIPG